MRQVKSIASSEQVDETCEQKDAANQNDRARGQADAKPRNFASSVCVCRSMAFVICLASLAAPAAATETFCAEHDALAAILGSRFGEHQQGVGLAGKEAMVELFVSEKGSFSLVSTDPHGLSCIFGAGDSWEKMKVGGTASAM